MDIYEQAYDTIVKIAEEEGVDLDDLSDEQVQELIEELVEEQAERNERNEGGEEVKEAHLTYADVAHELAKIAQVNGIDITQVSAEEYNAAFDKLASEMSDPSYWESQQKIAEADYIGRVMAQSFYDESQKIAAGRVRGALSRARELITGSKLKELSGETRSGIQAHRMAREVKKDPELLPVAKSQFRRDPLKETTREANKVIATRAALGLGGLGLAGGTAAALRGRGGDEEEKVAALDDFVTQRTVEILAEVGLI